MCMGCKTGAKERTTRIYTCTRCNEERTQNSCGKLREVCDNCKNKKNPCACGCGSFVTAALNNSKFISGHNVFLQTPNQRHERSKKSGATRIKNGTQVHPAEVRAKIAKTVSQRHKEGAFVNAYGNKVSKVELSLKPVLEPLGYEHTGEGGFHIRAKGGKTRIPDYVKRDTREIVEVWGTYWHRGENPQDLIDWYAEQGWTAQVVWENEVAEFAVNMGGA